MTGIRRQAINDMAIGISSGDAIMMGRAYVPDAGKNNGRNGAFERAGLRALRSHRGLPLPNISITPVSDNSESVMSATDYPDDMPPYESNNDRILKLQQEGRKFPAPPPSNYFGVLPDNYAETHPEDPGDTIEIQIQQP